MATFICSVGAVIFGWIGIDKLYAHHASVQTLDQGLGFMILAGAFFVCSWLAGIERNTDR